MKKKNGACLPSHRTYLRDMIDFDYLSRLSSSEIEFLSNFSQSYYHGTWTNEPGGVSYAECRIRDARARRDLFSEKADHNGVKRRRAPLPPDVSVDEEFGEQLRAGQEPVNVDGRGRHKRKKLRASA